MLWGVHPAAELLDQVVIPVLVFLENLTFLLTVHRGSSAAFEQEENTGPEKCMTCSKASIAVFEEPRFRIRVSQVFESLL